MPPCRTPQFTSNGVPTKEFHITEQCIELYHDTRIRIRAKGTRLLINLAMSP